MFYNGALWSLFWQEAQDKKSAILLVRAEMKRKGLKIDEVFVRSVHKDMKAVDKYLAKIGKSMQAQIDSGQNATNPLYEWYNQHVKPVARPRPAKPKPKPTQPQTDEEFVDETLAMLGLI